MEAKTDSKDVKPYEIPKEGSLGLLALGYKGLVAWRAVRGTEWIEERKKEHEELTKKMEAKKAEREEKKEGSTPESDKAASTTPKRLPAEELQPLTLTVVSGLPRSGTSMMMQMLTTGGMAAYTDEKREADESNPRGYFEHEKVKGVAKDSTWLPEADGKIVKIVAPLLRYLPPGPSYKVILMERDIDEILQSQSTMLDRDGRTAGDKDVLKRAYERQLQQAKTWLDRVKKAQFIEIAHRDAIEDPESVAQRIQEFLGADMPIEEMASVVDTSLYRERG